MKIEVRPSEIDGSVAAPPSKSYSHRAALVGLLSSETEVRDALDSADVRSSLACAEALGADVEHGDVIEMDGIAGRPEVPDDVLDCGNSGTTLRLFTGVSALADGVTVLTGDESLRSRPNGPLLDALTDLGAPSRSTRGDGRAPLVVEGPLEGGDVVVDGSMSSQFVSSLLFAAPLTEGVSIQVDGVLRSRPYVDVTIETMEWAGVDVHETESGFDVPGRQTYDAREIHVPGDFSSASYPLAAAAVTRGRARVSNLYPGAQGDQAVLEVLDDMGAEVSWDRDDGVVEVSADDLRATEFDASDTPDLVPTVAALGAVAEGETVVSGAAHLRYKESDRLEAMATELGRMGAVVQETDDGLRVDGSETDLRGAEVDGRHDHRVVMALAVAGLAADGTTSIDTAESVEISYPGFVDDMRALGASIDRA
ncbi:MAG: 3-phosphoshikimate 1-carboxyvinyltransferase [Halobacteriota archaeon]